jgi:hypothetical protein
MAQEIPEVPEKNLTDISPAPTPVTRDSSGSVRSSEGEGGGIPYTYVEPSTSPAAPRAKIVAGGIQNQRKTLIPDKLLEKRRNEELKKKGLPIPKKEKAGPAAEPKPEAPIVPTEVKASHRASTANAVQRNIHSVDGVMSVPQPLGQSKVPQASALPRMLSPTQLDALNELEGGPSTGSKSASKGSSGGGNGFFSLEELQSGLPEGVSKASKEMWLNDDMFYELFSMNKDDWAHVPAWKKKNLKLQNCLV